MQSAKTIIIGVDPGIKGAWAAYDFVEKRLIAARSMPVQKSPIDGKNHIDAKALGMWIDTYAHQTLFAVVEEPNAMPDEGVVSVFRFGHACGMVAGVLGALQIDTLFFKPSVWKMGMGLNNSKDYSRERAMALVPENKKLFSAKKDADKAEAFLLAVFGERFIRLNKKFKNA
jgi:crossover junction endodeoxyribonuclease RuvC